MLPERLTEWVDNEWVRSTDAAFAALAALRATYVWAIRLQL